MYNEVQDKVLEGLMSVALDEIMIEEDSLCPSEEELAKKYPTSKKMLRKYRRRSKELKYHNPMPIVYMRRVSVIVLAIISVSFGVLATSSEVRAAIVNTVVTWYDKYVQFDFSKSPESLETGDSNAEEEIKSFDELEIGYIPDGFELASYDESHFYKELIYMSESGDGIVIGIYTSESSDVLADIELTEFETMTINGHHAYCLYNDIDRDCLLTFGNKQYTVVITAICDKAEVIKIAENIK